MIPKLMATWTGPWRVVVADHAQVYAVKNIVSGKVHDAHVARLGFYADGQRIVTADLKDVFQHSCAQGECWMNALGYVAEDNGGAIIGLVADDEFDAEKRTRESLRKTSYSVATFVLKELRNLRMRRALKSILHAEYNIGVF